LLKKNFEFGVERFPLGFDLFVKPFIAWFPQFSMRNPISFLLLNQLMPLALGIMTFILFSSWVANRGIGFLEVI